MTRIEDDIRAAFAHRASTTTTSTAEAPRLTALARSPNQPLPSKQHALRYIGAAVALVAVVGGLVAVNHRGDESSPSGPVAPATTTAITVESPTTPTATTTADRDNTWLDYTTTNSPLPLWPQIAASVPAATTVGYGLRLCDDGFGTKVMRVDPAQGPGHAYSGTFCVNIQLDQPRLDATTSCATSTQASSDGNNGYTYARCQRRTTPAAPDGTGTSAPTTASGSAQAQMAAFPGPTRHDQDEPFGTRVTGAASGAAANFETVSVTLSTNADRVCASITLPGAIANACISGVLLSTGLAYGAFQNGDGPIEVVGLVPDEVTTIEINGTTVTPTSNVWHYTATSGKPLTITVRSASGTAASTN